MFAIDRIRRQFPVFRLTDDHPALVYLDNAATTQKPMVVIERLQQFYGHENANIHRGIYRLAHKATQSYERARTKVANFLNAKQPEEVVFCRGTTEAINMVAQGLRHQVTSEDEILVTAMEHHANYVPWQTLCKQTGASFRVAPLKENGSLDLYLLGKMLNKKTRVLAFTHISNTLGTINPVSEIVELAKKHQCLTVLDAAQSVAFDQVDVQDLNCDFLAFSGHKIFGPMGIGVLYGKTELLADLYPYQQGGGMITEVTEQESRFKNPPHGLEAGTPPVAEAIALGTALDFVSEIGLLNIREHSQKTLNYALDGLNRLGKVNTLGPGSGTSNIISFVMDMIHPHDVATILGEAGVAVRAGHHCCQPLMQALGINSTVRASFSIYNDTDDADRLIDALKTVQKIMS